jgi:hypothetical protein
VRASSIISWRRVRRERAASTEHRLDVDWEQFADGRIRRLRRGREYEAETHEVEDAATAAAARMGMFARFATEQVPRMKFFEDYVWIQFADHEVEPEQPCPCGEPNPVRVHPLFARCPSCDSRLVVKRPKGSKRGGRPSGAKPEGDEAETVNGSAVTARPAEPRPPDPTEAQPPDPATPPAPRIKGSKRGPKAMARRARRSARPKPGS